MMSDAQIQERKELIIKLVDYCISTEKSIKEMEIDLGVPSSTIQRHLNNREIIVNELGVEKYNKVQEILCKNKSKGLSTGGKVTQSRYSSLRDKIGKYNGLERK